MKYPDFDHVKNGPRTPKNVRFLKNAILLPNVSAIDPANHVLYRAFRQPPKNRCFWPSGPENHGFQPVSALFELNRSFRPISAEKWVCPPQKVDFFGPKPSPKNVTFVIFRPDRRGIFMRVNATSLVTRLYP